jgi:hypothetical protein
VPSAREEYLFRAPSLRLKLDQSLSARDLGGCQVLSSFQTRRLGDEGPAQLGDSGSESGSCAWRVPLEFCFPLLLRPFFGRERLHNLARANARRVEEENMTEDPGPTRDA